MLTTFWARKWLLLHYRISKTWIAAHASTHHYDLEKLKHRFHTIRNRYIRNDTTVDLNMYKQIKNKYANEIRKAKNNSWKMFIEELDNDNPYGNLYKVLKSKLKKNNNNLSIIDDTNPLEQQLKASDLLDKMFPNDDSYTDTSEHYVIRNHLPRYLNNAEFQTNFERVSNIIKFLGRKKAPGPDNISNNMLRFLPTILTETITVIFNKCLKLGYFPDTWKTAVVRIIPKPNKQDYSHHKSYRPISLTSNMSKVFERIIKEEIMHHAQTANILSNHQFGFMPKKSTTDALKNIFNEAIEAKKKGPAAIIAVDISGAFDHAWWSFIKYQIDSYNFPETIIKIINSYLSNRNVRFSYNNITVAKSLNRGCPQGGAMSPILWNLIINDLLVNFKIKNCKIFAYADDATVICHNRTLDDLKTTIKDAITFINDWCLKVKLSISTEKTEILYLTNCPPPTIVLNNSKINPSKEIKILGVTFKNHRFKDKLNFQPHIAKLEAKVLRIKNILFGLSGKIWGINTKKRKILYKTVIRPIITYASEAWYPYINKKESRKINSIQYNILKFVVSAYRTTSFECIHLLADIPLITDYIELMKSKKVLSIQGMDNDFIKSAINTEMDKLRNKYLNNANNNFRQFFPTGVPKYFSPNFYSTQFVTGHGNFKEYLHNIGKTDTPSCTCNHIDIQSPIHLLTACDNFTTPFHSPHLYISSQKNAIKFNNICKHILLHL